MSQQSREDLMQHAKSQSIALIYSPVELHEYIVELIDKDSDKFIHNGRKVVHFHSIDEAVLRATEYGAKEFFLCVDNTYDEFGSQESSKFEYIPLRSKSSH